LDQTVDALIGAGYGSAGERCMAISVAVPVGEDTANRLMAKLIPRVESLKVVRRLILRQTSARWSPRRIWIR
jgi:malonate-semialdehyde dehydrogenase (acetylating) / methylmalonate-semialdehyde dehydrogenase